MTRIPLYKWPDQFVELPNKSSFHNSVRNIFCTDPFFQNLHCYQEVNLKELIDSYPSNHYFDWYIKELNTVIELHGKQHYTPTSFGQMSYEEKMLQFNSGKLRDKEKQIAAESNQFKYVVISYKEKIDAEHLKQLIL